MTNRANPHSITSDPVFYITVGFFVLLTTALPALLGQHRFLPIVQTLALTVFVAMAYHQRNPRSALYTLAIWLPLQFILVMLLARFAGDLVEQAIPNGFDYRGAVLIWFFGGGVHPTDLSTTLMARLLELVGIVLGSLVSAGLLGIWVLMRVVNQSAFGVGALWTSLGNMALFPLILPYWSLLRFAGYAGLIALCAEPLLTYTFSPAFYWRRRRRLIIIALALTLAGLLLELFLPGLMARPPRV